VAEATKEDNGTNMVKHQGAKAMINSNEHAYSEYSLDRKKSCFWHTAENSSFPLSRQLTKKGPQQDGQTLPAAQANQ